MNDDLNEKNDFSSENLNLFEIGFRQDLTAPKNKLEIEEGICDVITKEFPREIYRESWRILIKCEELTILENDEKAKLACSYWNDMEICAKYEKKFNLYIEQAKLEMGKEVEMEQKEENLTVPDLKCFSLDFKLGELHGEKKVLMRNRYRGLSALKLKRNLYFILFSQRSMIENPFILDFNLNNIENGQKSNKNQLVLIT
jgi:hypothetical protein